MAIDNLKSFHMTTQMFTQIFHFGHVSVDDAFEDTFLEFLDLLLRELLPNKIIFIHIKKFESFSNMVAFLEILIAIHLESIRLRDNMILIIKAIMADIVTESGN